MNVFEKVGEDILHVVEYPFVHGEKLVDLLEAALKNEPAVQTAITGLIKQVGALTADGAIAISARGVDLPDDLATLAAAQVLWGYVTKTFIPEIEAAYRAIASIVDPASQPKASAPAAVSTVAPGTVSVIRGPGLHMVAVK